MENSFNQISYQKDGILVDETVTIGKNVTIYPGNVILNGSVIEDNVVLYPGNFITASEIGEGSTLTGSTIEQSKVHKNVKIGPNAHLRPNSVILDNARIGNFVEIKNSTIGKGTKVSHLSYVGDADVGDNVNIGCGVVFINYNGKTKSRSTVEDNCFIGSSVNVIAPVTIRQGTYVCAGTTVDKSIVEDDCFVIGRSRMTVKAGRAKKYFGKE